MLKRHYSTVAVDPNRTVFEHLVFACCLENAHYDRAEEAFAALVHNFFDWNEVRVSTVRELSEVMACLPDPAAAANRVKRVLQSIFESTYSFDLEELRKQNLGPATKQLEKLDGTTKFCVAYAVQAALGGHAIPVDAGVLGALEVVELVTEENVREGVVPGLERAVAKSKGIEFGSQLHQLGADFVQSPYAPDLHKILLEIDPEARDRLPRRRARRRVQPAAAEEAGEQSGKPRRAAEQKAEKRKKKRRSRKPRAAEQEPAEGKQKPAQADPASPQKKAASTEKSPGSSKRATSKKKTDTGKAKPEAEAGRGKSASSGLSKRKPR